MKLQRGFKHVRKKAMERGAFIADCNSCWYKNKHGECTNHNATIFDAVETNDGRHYCTWWSMEERL